jgi:hypothetical protein
MGLVADALTDWADSHDMQWSRRDAAVAWAAAQGDDLRAAWERCPRADDLMGLAGVLQPPMARVVITAGRLARPALALTEKRDALATRAVYLAETWGAANARAAKTVGEQLAAHMTRTGARYHESRRRLTDASVDTLGAMVRAEVALHGERLRAMSDGGDVSWVEAEASRMLTEAASVAKLRAFGRQACLAQREMARVTALAATLELCRAVESAHAALRSMGALSAMSDGERAAVDDALVNELAAASVTAECSVYGLVAGALGMAAEAHARAAVAAWCDAPDSGFLRAAATGVCEAAAHGLTRPQEPLTTLTLHVAMERVIEGERTQRLRAMAEAMRREIPWEVLARRDRYA